MTMGKGFGARDPALRGGIPWCVVHGYRRLHIDSGNLIVLGISRRTPRCLGSGDRSVFCHKNPLPGRNHEDAPRDFYLARVLVYVSCCQGMGGHATSSAGICRGWTVRESTASVASPLRCLGRRSTRSNLPDGFGWSNPHCILPLYRQAGKLALSRLMLDGGSASGQKRMLLHLLQESAQGRPTTSVAGWLVVSALVLGTRRWGLSHACIYSTYIHLGYLRDAATRSCLMG